MKKALTVAVAAIFTCTNISFAHKPSVNLWEERLQIVQPIAAARLQLPEYKHAAPFSKGLPETFFAHMNIKEIHRQAGTQTVVLIEDLHQNLEAQTHISAAIKSFGDAAGDTRTLVALEGAAGAFVYDQFRKFPNRDGLQESADSHLNSNSISGPAHAGFTFRPQPGKQDLFFWGLENPTLYRRNVQAYRTSHEIQSTTQSHLDGLIKDVNEQKIRNLNVALRAFDSVVQSHRAGSLSLGEYAQALARTGETTSLNVETFLQAYAMENSIDFPRVEFERARVLEKLVKKISKDDMNNLMNMSLGYQQGVVTFSDYYAYLRSLCKKAGVELAQTPAFDNYIRYVLLSDGVDASKLFTDLEAMEQSGYNHLASKGSEKNLVALSSQLYLAKELVQYALTSEQWAQYQKGRSLLKGQIELSSFEEFYVAADLRNEVMMNNLQKKLKDNAVLVAGGYHTQGLTDLLKKNNFSYVVATPKVTKIASVDETHYLSVFDREKTPLEKLFAGKKLFLAVPVSGQLNAELSQDLGIEDKAEEIAEAAGGTINRPTGKREGLAGISLLTVTAVLVASGGFSVWMQNIWPLAGFFAISILSILGFHFRDYLSFGENYWAKSGRSDLSTTFKERTESLDRWTRYNGHARKKLNKEFVDLLKEYLAGKGTLSIERDTLLTPPELMSILTTIKSDEHQEQLKPHLDRLFSMIVQSIEKWMKAGGKKPLSFAGVEKEIAKIVNPVFDTGKRNAFTGLELVVVVIGLVGVTGGFYNSATLGTIILSALVLLAISAMAVPSQGKFGNGKGPIVQQQIEYAIKKARESSREGGSEEHYVSNWTNQVLAFLVHDPTQINFAAGLIVAEGPQLFLNVFNDGVYGRHKSKAISEIQVQLIEAIHARKNSSAAGADVTVADLVNVALVEIEHLKMALPELRQRRDELLQDERVLTNVLVENISNTSLGDYLHDEKADKNWLAAADHNKSDILKPIGGYLFRPGQRETFIAQIVDNVRAARAIKSPRKAIVILEFLAITYIVSPIMATSIGFSYYWFLLAPVGIGILIFLRMNGHSSIPLGDENEWDDLTAKFILATGSLAPVEYNFEPENWFIELLTELSQAGTGAPAHVGGVIAVHLAPATNRRAKMIGALAQVLATPMGRSPQLLTASRQLLINFIKDRDQRADAELTILQQNQDRHSSLRELLPALLDWIGEDAEAAAALRKAAAIDNDNRYSLALLRAIDAACDALLKTEKAPRLRAIGLLKEALQPRLKPVEFSITQQNATSAVGATREQLGNLPAFGLQLSTDFTRKFEKNAPLQALAVFARYFGYGKTNMEKIDEDDIAVPGFSYRLIDHVRGEKTDLATTISFQNNSNEVRLNFFTTDFKKIAQVHFYFETGEHSLQTSFQLYMAVTSIPRYEEAITGALIRGLRDIAIVNMNGSIQPDGGDIDEVTWKEKGTLEPRPTTFSPGQKKVAVASRKNDDEDKDPGIGLSQSPIILSVDPSFKVTEQSILPTIAVLFGNDSWFSLEAKQNRGHWDVRIKPKYTEGELSLSVVIPSANNRVVKLVMTATGDELKITTKLEPTEEEFLLPVTGALVNTLLKYGLVLNNPVIAFGTVTTVKGVANEAEFRGLFGRPYPNRNGFTFLELIPFVGIPFGLIAFVFTTSWYWLVLLPVAVVALFILKVSNGSTANRNAPPTPAPTPVVTSSDPNVRKIISEVALEKVFSANDKRLYGGLANALEQDPAAQESSPIVYQYLIDDAGFAQSLQDIDGIFRRSHNYKPDIVISAKELSLEQKREIVSHLRGKANYQIVDITTETVDLDEVLKQAETLPHVRTLLRQFAGVRVITIDPTGIPFTASEGLQHLMSVVLMNLRGDWAGVSVETAIAAFKDASIKA